MPTPTKIKKPKTTIDAKTLNTFFVSSFQLLETSGKTIVYAVNKWSRWKQRFPEKYSVTTWSMWQLPWRFEKVVLKACNLSLAAQFSSLELLWNFPDTLYCLCMGHVFVKSQRYSHNNTIRNLTHRWIQSGHYFS